MAPASRNGQARPSGWSSPASAGPTGRVTYRAVLVTAAAAVRSAGGTSAITYAWRVGTSICDSTVRASSNPTAAGRVGASGTAASSRLDGRWVNTIVRSSPTLAASSGAARNEAACSSPMAANTTPITLVGAP